MFCVFLCFCLHSVTGNSLATGLNLKIFLFVKRSGYLDRAVSWTGIFSCVFVFSVDSDDMRCAVYREMSLMVSFFDQRARSEDRSIRDFQTGILHIFWLFKFLSFIYTQVPCWTQDIWLSLLFCPFFLQPWKISSGFNRWEVLWSGQNSLHLVRSHGIHLWSRKKL